MSDFGVVLNASNMGRVKSVTVLNELYMRMAETVSTQVQIDRQATQPQRVPQTPPAQQTVPGPDSSFTSPVADSTWNSRDSPTPIDVANSAVGSSLVGMTSTGSRIQPCYTPGVTSNPSSHSHTSSGTTGIIRDPEGPASTGSPSSTKKDYRHAVSPSELESDPSGTHRWRHPFDFPRPNTVTSDAKSAYTSSSGASIVSVTSPENMSHNNLISSYDRNDVNNICNQNTVPWPPLAASSSIANSGFGASIIPQVSPDTMSHTTNLFKAHSSESGASKIPFHSSPSPEHRKRLNNRSKPKRAATQDPSAHVSPSPLTTSKSSFRKFSLFGGHKASKEDYAGFCQGAHLMQLGDDGMKLRNQSVSFTGQNNYWTCSNSMCCFEGRAVPLKRENKKTSFGYDEDIREAYGVKYRWSFLAKSHTMIGNSKSGFEFQCAFCVGQGAPHCRIKGDKKFMQHVATHQGQSPNERCMPQLEYILGREASDWEVFDVNLPAPTAILLETLEQPVELEALEHELPEMEAPLVNSKRGMRPSAETNGNVNLIDRSGLGIRMSTGTISGILQDYGGDRSLSMGSQRTQQPSDGVDWQDDASRRPLRNGTSNYTEAEYEGKEINTDDPLEPSEPTTIRDSVYSLHPAPLFARRPSSGSADTEQERNQQKQQHQHQHQHQHGLHHHHHHQGHKQAPKPLPEALQREEGEDGQLNTYPYDDTADIVDPELRGSVPLHNP